MRIEIAQPVYGAPFDIDTTQQGTRLRRWVIAWTRAWVWAALSMLRRKRITPPGRTSRSQAASSALSSGPSRPTTSTWPAACRNGHGTLTNSSRPRISCLSSSSKIQCLQRRQAVGIGLLQPVQNALREGGKHGQLQGCIRLLGDVPLLGLFVLQQHLAGAFNHREWQPGQPRHLDAVALVRRARLNGVQKHDALGGFFDRHPQVLQSGQLLRQQSELMVVGSEEGSRADLGMQIFKRCPSQGESIEGSRSAAHFVQQDERLPASRC